jgi:hypothetical protein
MIDILNDYPSKIMMVPIEKLFIDHQYQRTLNEIMVNRIIDNFDSRAMGILIVSKRDFGYAIIDGQHRFYAAKKMGHKFLECAVFNHLSLSEESKLFSTINLKRKSVKMIDQFNAMLVYGDEDANNIKKILENLDFKIGKHSSNKGSRNTISCVETLLHFYKKLGFNEFYNALSLLKEAYDGDYRTLEQKFVGGFCIFYEKYGKEFKKEEFLEKLSKVPVSEINRDARTIVEYDGGNGKFAVAKILLKIYNKGRRTRQLGDKFR